jgi:hypothetical protein
MDIYREEFWPIPPYYHRLWHCDGLQAPALIDGDRVREHYSEGLLWGWNSTLDNPATATWRWFDGAWSDYEHDVVFFYCGTDCWDPNNYHPFAIHRHFQDIGVRSDMQLRVLSVPFNPAWYGMPAGTYGVCGWPWFEAFGAYGLGTCSGDAWYLVPS